MINRTDVYKAVDSERDFQDGFIASQGLVHNKTVGEFLTLIRTYSAKADLAWVGNAGDAAALEEIRKLAALCVSCMETHGVKPRRSNKSQVLPSNIHPPKAVNVPWTSIVWTKVSSSNIQAIRYNPSSGGMQIRFHDSGTYEFYDVPGTVYVGLLAASSKGRFFHNEIRGKFLSSKLD